MSEHASPFKFNCEANGIQTTHTIAAHNSEEALALHDKQFPTHMFVSGGKAKQRRIKGYDSRPRGENVSDTAPKKFRRIRGNLEVRKDILSLLASSSVPLTRSALSVKIGLAEQNIKVHMRAMENTGLVNKQALGEGNSGYCQSCGAPLFGKVVWSITPEGRAVLKFMLDNEEVLNRINASVIHDSKVIAA